LTGMKILKLATVLTSFLVLFSSTLSAGGHGVLDYPRVVSGDGMEVKIHHPVVDSWRDYAVLEAWVPVEITDQSTNQQWVGALRIKVNTKVRLEEQLVELSDASIIDTSFSDSMTPARAIDFARNSIRSQRQEVTLNELILSLADDFSPPQQRPVTGFNRNPPRIVVSQRPASLLLIDQQPVKAPIIGTTLEQVVNTDWNLFYDTDSRSWFVINAGVWQTQSLLASGDWSIASNLPEDFSRLPDEQGWQVVQGALPPQIPATAPPALIVSLEPTELIVIDGEPRLQLIPGADGLMEVANSESALFQLEDTWYFLAAGRWFETASLDKGWAAVSELPGAFAKIPQDHGRAAVRESVPGTMEAALAYIAATLPQNSSVPMEATPSQEVVYVGAPRFEPISGTGVERAVNSPFAVIRHNNAYYLNFEAAWYRSDSPTGPWKPALVVPDAIFDIPPSDPLYYVTYVRPAGNQPQAGEARFTYSEGYNGMYTIGVNAVRGTGWAYQPWIGYPGGTPVYWSYPPTFGWGYPRGATWGSGYRNPYYYWGGYAPMQDITIRGQTRSLDGAMSVAGQDPRLARPGYDYTTLAEQRLDDSRAAGYVADDLFADPQGRVYKRQDDGWSKHEDGNWSTMAELERQYGTASGPQLGAPESPQRQAYKQNPDDIERMERYYDRRSRSYNSYMNIYVPR